MNYRKLYVRIIEKRKNSTPDGYTEIHHIIPRSLNGSDEKENLVALTAREHFICHYLLAKMYEPESFEWYKMNHAFLKMKCVSTDQDRYFNSRLYEALAENRSKVMSLVQKGENNSQHGSRWIYNIDTLETKKIDKCDLLPERWEFGRRPDYNYCRICEAKTKNRNSTLCEYHLRQSRKNNVKSGLGYRRRKDKEDYDKFYQAITTSSTWKEAIAKAGYKTDGYSRTRLKRFAAENNIKLMVP